MRLNATDEKIDAEDVDKNDTQIVGMERKSGAVHSDAAVAGAVSGFITRLICQPLDVVKIRFQVSKITRFLFITTTKEFEFGQQ